jgi:hypothetical protein
MEIRIYGLLTTDYGLLTTDHPLQTPDLSCGILPGARKDALAAHRPESERKP